MNLLAKLRAMGASATGAPPQWAAFRAGPGESADLDRVVALRRRVLQATPELAAEYTARLKRPAGIMSLRPIQAAALAEGEILGGLLGAIGPGWGKTLISLLLFTVWGSKNGVLLLPSKLASKLLNYEYPELAKHWRIPNIAQHNIQYTDTKVVIHVVSYSDLSSAKRQDCLEKIQPDAIVCDEGHALRHSSAARTKRFLRYLRGRHAARSSLSGADSNARPEAEPRGTVGQDAGRGVGILRAGQSAPHPTSAVAASQGRDLHPVLSAISGGQRVYRRLPLAVLSGTITAGSIRDYAHLARYTLGDGSPLPLDWNTLQEWSYTLDASEFPAPDGTLRRLCTGDEPVRAGFGRRLVETPGVIATTNSSGDAALTFNRVPLTAPKIVLDALVKLRSDWRRPDGMPLREAIEVYAASRQLACGFYYRTTYPRGEPLAVRQEWIAARKEYFSEVRERLSLSLRGQDSFLLLWRAAASGAWRSETWARWARVRKSVKPSSETVWLDRFLVDAAIEWARKPGIVWVESEAVKAAVAIAEGAGIPVYASSSQLPELMAEDGKRAVVCSLYAFGEGCNLQGAFHRNLITTSPASNSTLEQVIARTHRPYQPADEVTVDFFLHTPELVAALKTAREKARYVEESTLGQQKLCLGTWLF